MKIQTIMSGILIPLATSITALAGTIDITAEVDATAWTQSNQFIGTVILDPPSLEGYTITQGDVINLNINFSGGELLKLTSDTGASALGFLIERPNTASFYDVSNVSVTLNNFSTDGTGSGTFNYAAATQSGGGIGAGFLQADLGIADGQFIEFSGFQASFTLTNHNPTSFEVSFSVPAVSNWTIGTTTPPPPSQAIDWVTIGDPLNDPNPAINTPSAGCCTIDYEFEISRHEITNGQYIQMLNAVGASDDNDLYSTFMTGTYSGITRSGSPGTYTYELKAGFANKPVNYVSLYDAMRFANWLQNGKPSGAQDNTTTEDGAYTITTEGVTNNTIVRNADAEYFIPTWDEWRKAGYYDGETSTWYDYPTGSNTQMVGSIPVDDAGNNGNCGLGVTLYDVGSYTLSNSPYGTFDQGGSVTEWTETITGLSRETVGSNFAAGCSGTHIDSAIISNPSQQASNRGFRLARPGEPATNIPLPLWALVSVGMVLAGLGVVNARGQSDNQSGAPQSN